MTRDELKDKLYKNFSAYYTFKQEDVTEPFYAEAVYGAKDEGYFLLKIAKISESESTEFLYFADVDALNEEKLVELEDIAWKEGMSHLNIGKNHKSTDVSLIILCDSMDDAVIAKAKKMNRVISYSWGFKGYSKNRLVAVEIESGRIATNRQGDQLKKLFRNIYK